VKSAKQLAVPPIDGEKTMRDGQPTCAKCGSEMEEGFIPDSRFDVFGVSKWIRGAPEKSWIGGVKEPARKWFGGALKDKSAVREIKSFRCVKCGFLENYAN
jgi:ribosomal protein S27AE